MTRDPLFWLSNIRLTLENFSFKIFLSKSCVFLSEPHILVYQFFNILPLVEYSRSLPLSFMNEYSHCTSLSLNLFATTSSISSIVRSRPRFLEGGEGNYASGLEGVGESTEEVTASEKVSASRCQKLGATLSGCSFKE